MIKIGKGWFEGWFEGILYKYIETIETMENMENIENIEKENEYTYLHSENAGKHMICDLKEIENMELLNDANGIQTILDEICSRYSFQVLHRKVHTFDPIGLTMFYLLSESHISVHTFPERRFMALDIYTCRSMSDNSVYEEIYALLVSRFCAKVGDLPLILVRRF